MTTRAAALAAVLSAAAASAHPVPQTQIDRALTVRLSPAALAVDYDFEIDQSILFWVVTQFDDIPEDLDGLDDYRRAFAGRVGVVLADQLRARLGGEPLTFRVASSKFTKRPARHTLIQYRFVAEWDIEPGRDVSLTFAEDTSLGEVKEGLRPGKITLKFADPAGIRVIEKSLPDPALLARGPADLTDADLDRMRRLAVTFRVIDESAELAPAAQESEDDRSFWTRLKEDGLSALLESGLGVGLLLLAAGVFGAGHALTPGHGKTMVAAYLVGERGTAWHAVVLGLVTTLTHTGAVILIAFGLWRLYPDAVPADVQSALGIIGGLLIAGLGVWLLLRRAAGRADHVHVTDGPKAGDGWGRLIALGVMGGIVPCWDAVALLGIAITANKLWLAVPLLLAFSAGLAAVLVAIGLAVVYAKKLGAGRFRGRAWFKALPLVSAVLLIAIGLWLCKQSL